MKKPKFIPEFDDVPTRRVRMPELPLEERGGSFDEVELGLTQELALAEAARCLSCRRCIGCGLCLAECDPQAIVYDQEPEERRLEVDAVLVAAGAGCFNAADKPALGYSTSPNVVTAPELERILSPTGPYGGIALRPGDGTPPGRVAFVQCVGSREEGIGANFCSTSCCNSALKLADDLIKRAGTTNVTFFHRGMRPLGRRGEALYRAARDGDRVEFVFADVKGVAAGDCTAPVSVTFDAGEGDSTAEFDLVVLSVGSRASSTARSIARRVRAPFNKFGYVETGALSPVSAGEGGVPVAGGLTEPTDAAGATAAAQAAASAAAAAPRAAPVNGEPDEAGGGRSTSTAGGGPALVWVCGYGLRSSGVDPDEVVAAAAALDDVGGAVRSELACSPAAVARLADSLAEHDAGRVLVVGCHPSTHARFWERKLSGLRDHPLKAELVDAGADASGTVANVGERVGRGTGSPGGPDARKLERRLLVVGGGLSGLTAAEEAARRGVPVTLVEAGDVLGGRLARRATIVEGLVEGLASLVERLTSDAAVDVLTGSAVAGVEDVAAGFETAIDGPDGRTTVRHGAVVVATDSEDYDPPEHADRGEASVLTQSEFAHRLVSGSADVASVVMIQCVGSRTPERPYCSRACCAEAMSNILKLKEQSPGADVTVLHKGIRVWGFDEELFADAIDLGVRFVRVDEPPAISADGTLAVTAVDVDAGEELRLTPDLIVLSTGVRPARANTELATALGLTLDGNGFFVPVDEALRPVETERPGIYVCGSACWPASVRDSVVQARAAAGRACLFLRGGRR